MPKRSLIALLALVSSVMAISFLVQGGVTDYDVLIKKAKLIDGTGNPWFYGDIGIKGDSISEIGDLKGKSAVQVIDAQGMIAAPGFIDVHTHCDRGLGNPETKANLNYLTQGVTTVVVGNCGMGTFKIAETINKWETQGIGTNAVLLVGFGTVRREIMRNENRAPSADELERMKFLFRRAMEEGAWGLSTGLQYIPDRYAATEEVIALAKIAGEFGGIYTSHQRDEEERLLEAVQETIRIGKEAGVRVNAAHLKAAGKNNWGLMGKAVSLINKARAEGISITADMYPYDKASTTPLLAIFNVPKDMAEFAEIGKKLESEKTTPAEMIKVLDMAADLLAKALADKEKREKIKLLTVEGDPEKVNWVKSWGWHNFTIVGARKNTRLIGKIFSDLARETGRDPFDIAADLLIEEKADIIISLASMSEDDMKEALRQDWLMISSDGDAVPYGRGSVHPRNYGSFPRALRKYVREEKILALEQAIRKMSSLPAHLLGMKRRGLLLEGFKADIVLFDPDRVQDNATYLDPHLYSSGIEYVLVNGKPSIERGRYNQTLNGKVLPARDKK